MEIPMILSEEPVQTIVPHGYTEVFSARLGEKDYCAILVKIEDENKITKNKKLLNLEGFKLFLTLTQGLEMNEYRIENGAKMPGHWYVASFAKNHPFFLSYFEIVHGNNQTEKRYRLTIGDQESIIPEWDVVKGWE